MTVTIRMGGAGTGKSTELKELIKANPIGTMTVAPTGVAALLVGGATGHKAFGISTNMVGEGDIMRSPERLKWMGLDNLFIDEGFMFRADVMNVMNWKLQINRGNKFEPFGGVNVTIFGDPFQLPPILKKGEEATYKAMGYDSKWIMSLPFMREAKVEILTKCYRQDDLTFIKALNEIRLGDFTKETLDVINSRVRVPLESPFITLTPYNNDVDKVNQSRYDEVKGKEQCYLGLLEDKFDPKDCVSPMELWLKPGVQVMMTKNDPSNRWVNGTMAIVKRLGNKVAWVDIKGVEQIVEAVTWDKVESDYDRTTKKTTPKVIGSFTQLPMRLAYAITIHKSQGQTLSKGYVELNGAITTEGQAYVMLSRFTSLEAFSLSRPLTPSDIRVNMEVKRWYESIAS